MSQNEQVHNFSKKKKNQKHSKETEHEFTNGTDQNCSFQIGISEDKEILSCFYPSTFSKIVQTYFVPISRSFDNNLSCRIE